MDAVDTNYNWQFYVRQFYKFESIINDVRSYYYSFASIWLRCEQIMIDSLMLDTFTYPIQCEWCSKGNKIDSFMNVLQIVCFIECFLSWLPY